MSQTRQPIQVFPKITLKLGVWGRVGLILAVITAIASYVLYHNGVRYKDREKAHFQELSQQIQQLQQGQQKNFAENASLHQQIEALNAQFTQLKVGLEPEQRQIWLVKQVSRYIELAEQQLLLQADIPSAEILLAVADKLLADNADTNLLDLREAIAADKLTWTHVSDLKGWSSDVAATYAVQSIPANFLLDPQGVIIAKDLRGADLANKLAELIH